MPQSALNPNPGAPAAAAACRHLRTKTFYYQQDGAEMQASAIASYWCMRSLRAAGPDEDLVEPRLCHAGRVCYEAEN